MEARLRDQQFFSTLVRKTFQSIISPFRFPRAAWPLPILSNDSSTSALSIFPKWRKIIDCTVRSGSSAPSITTGSLHPQERLGTPKSLSIQANALNLEEHQSLLLPQHSGGLDHTRVNLEVEKHYHALLFTEDMVAQLQDTIKAGNQTEYLEKELSKAKFEAINADTSMTQSHHLLNTAQTQEEIDQTNEHIEELGPILQEACERRDHLEREIRIYKSNLESSQSRSIGIIERLLAEAGLLDRFAREGPTAVEPCQGTTSQVATSDHISESHIDGTPYTRDPFTRVPITWTNGSAVSLEEVNRRAIFEDLEQAHSKLTQIQMEFDNRDEDCKTARENYHQDVLEGTCDIPVQEFDLIQLRAIRSLTRDLVDAEAEYEVLVARARGLNLVVDDPDQESNFADREDDGYAESQEAPRLSTSRGELIEAWLDQVEKSQDISYPPSEPGKGEKWDAKQFEIGSSISCIDNSRNRRRIDLWRAHCEELTANLVPSSA